MGADTHKMCLISHNTAVYVMARHGRCRFHVDDLSSAHVYLRLPEGVDMDAIPAETLEDCCQLVTAWRSLTLQPGMQPDPPGCWSVGKARARSQ
jgi:NFACT protein RNA binding domain